MDYDYYKRKVAEMVTKPASNSDKLMRNAEKLSSSEAAYLNVKNELVARMSALIAERWDFANAPLLQLLDFQQVLPPPPIHATHQLTGKTSHHTAPSRRHA